MSGFDEVRRWETLREIQHRYLKHLDALQLWDVQTARLVAIDKRECRSERDIVLVAMADLNGAQRAMLDQVSDRVTALVAARPEWMDRFDEHGCLAPDAWQSVSIAVDPAQVLLAERPPDQAREVLRWLGRFEGRFAVDEITIGVPDESLVPHLDRQLRQAGLATRWGPGSPLSRTAPCLLLAAVARYVERDRFPDLAALVRHPDVLGWLERQDLKGDWLSGLDDLQAEHLPARLEPWLLEKWTEEQRDPRLIQGLAAVEQLVAPLRGEVRRLGAWSAPLLELLLTVYRGRRWNTHETQQRATVRGCEALHEVLRKQEKLQDELTPRVAAPEAIRLALEQLRDERVAPPLDADAIEVLGWLELPLDDAPALIVTSFNEGIVPTAVNSDLFLPNSLRAALQLEDNARRLARDAYALSVLTESRRELRLVVGRRDADNNPLIPSRLLLAAKGTEVARRVREYFRMPPQLPPLRLPGRPGGRDKSDLPVPPPRPLEQPIESLRVTAFRSYLACPYRFYLSQILKLYGREDTAEELDGGAFGTILHDVLQRFAEAPERDTCDERLIREVLNRELAECVEMRLGSSPRTPVAVQIEQMRLRLHAFAEQQAAWSAQGWKIAYSEYDATDQPGAGLETDGRFFGLRGRIDRIDVHATSGEVAVLDYKSSDKGKRPEQTHQKGEEWIDLQLPLYRHLLKPLGLDGPVRLGYVNLPKDIDDSKFLLADWTEDVLRRADEVARQVIRGVWEERFWPPTSPPPQFSEEFAAICQDTVFAAAEIVVPDPLAAGSVG